MSNLLHADLTYKLRGIGFRIHSALGPGHLEEDYERALLWALQNEGIPFENQPDISIDYKGWQVGLYRPDLTFVDRALIVDLKATTQIEALHKAQVLSYLRVTDAELGMIMNFGGASMQFERLPNFMGNRQPASYPLNIGEGFLFPKLTNQIIDALQMVHVTLGPGFLHQVYRRAARREMMLRLINFDYIKELPLRFEQCEIRQRPTRLFHIEQKLLVATVALRSVGEEHLATLRWAMKQLDCQLGLIANFYPTELEVRFARSG